MFVKVIGSVMTLSTAISRGASGAFHVTWVACGGSAAVVAAASGDAGEEVFASDAGGVSRRPQPAQTAATTMATTNRFRMWERLSTKSVDSANPAVGGNAEVANLLGIAQVDDGAQARHLRAVHEDVVADREE